MRKRISRANEVVSVYGMKHSVRVQVTYSDNFSHRYIVGNSITVSNADLAVASLNSSFLTMGVVPRALGTASLSGEGIKSTIGLRSSVVNGCIRHVLNQKHNSLARSSLEGTNFYNEWRIIEYTYLHDKQD